MSSWLQRIVRGTPIHYLELVLAIGFPIGICTNLAPITAVLLLKTNFSSNVYTPPGIVPKAAVSSAFILV